MVEIEEISVQILYRELPSFPRLFFQRIHDVRSERLQFLVRTHRHLQRTPSERKVRTAASSSESISPHHRVTRTQSLCLGKAIQSQSRVHLGNAAVRVRHQRPATPALAGPSSSFSPFRPQRSPSDMQQDRQRGQLGHYLKGFGKFSNCDWGNSRPAVGLAAQFHEIGTLIKGERAWWRKHEGWLLLLCGSAAGDFFSRTPGSFVASRVDTRGATTLLPG